MTNDYGRNSRHNGTNAIGQKYRIIIETIDDLSSIMIKHGTGE